MQNKQILNYKTTTQIGKGGMATVYKAKHINLDTVVAIKVLDPVLATNSKIRQRFKQEAKIMASLNHENITKVIDYEETDKRLAILMEHLQGQTLNDYIKQQGALAPAEAKKIFIKILEAFSYAHKKGIVHRDIKPSNIFITNKGKIKIMDFGIAKIVEDGANILTQTGTQMGTPAYMSPEQVNDSKRIDHLSDIYSLGVVLWFMLSGKPPYDANTSSTFSIYKMIDTEPLANLSDTEMNAIVQKATVKDKDNRFGSCEEFAKSFGSEITIADPPPLPPPIPEPVPQPPIPKPEPKPVPPQPKPIPPMPNNNVESLSWFGYFRKAFKNYANFSGRARRKEYWFFFLFHVIFLFTLLGMDVQAGSGAALSLLYLLASLLPSIAIGVRRIQDTGNNGWLILVPIYYLVLFCTDSQKGENKYGPNPKNE